MISCRNVFNTLSCLIIQFLLVEAKSANSNDCNNSTRDFHQYLSSSAPYQSIRGDIERPEGCTPLQIWMTAGHGTRHAETVTEQQMIDLEEFRDRIISNHEQGRGQMCTEDLTSLHLWQKNPNIYDGRNDILVDEEKHELHLLAKRLKNEFPEVLKSNNPRDYNFKITNHERTDSSLITFANALLSSSAAVDYEDNEFEASKDCPRRHEDQMAEFRKFKNGPYVQQALRKISERLGFVQTVGFDTVNSMYKMCRHETTLHPGNMSVWCSGFSKEDVMIFEYLSDLDYYYCCGPGNRLSKKMSCGILKKLFDTFSQIQSDKTGSQPNGVFNFDHPSNVQSVLTLLKVYQSDEPLLASNYESMKHKLFNSSFINSISSNVVAVLYRCDNVAKPNQVQFHVSENPVEVPGCDGHLCDWEYLKREFRPVLGECDANLCNFPRDGSMISASSTKDSYLPYFVILSSLLIVISSEFE